MSATNNEQFGYKWGAVSANDPNQNPLRYKTQVEAQAHADHMDKLIPTWDDPDNKFWNRDHWKVRPEPWVVKPL